MAEKKYKIVYEPIPPTKIVRVTIYDSIVEEFAKSGKVSGRIEYEEIKPTSLASSLKDAIKRKGIEEEVKVSTRKDKIYLVKIK